MVVFPVWGGRALDGLRDAVEDLVAVVPRVVLVPVTGPGDRTVWTPLRNVGAQVMPWAEGEDLKMALRTGERSTPWAG